MKIGLLAYSSKTGLGYQTREFYKHIPCSKVLIVDISKLNGMEVDHSWCKQARVTNGYPTDEDCEWLVDGMDVVFICETPLNYHLFEYAQKQGVKTVNQYNFEFCDYFRDSSLPKPTVMASPSVWGMEKVKEICERVELWSVPVNTDEIQVREINEVNTFIHIIGRPAARDRNGTLAFIKAALSLGDRYTYKVFVQMPTDSGAMQHFQPVLEKIMQAQIQLGDKFKVIVDVKNNLDIYKQGEVLVLPRRYGGLCLPMWESLASGVPVIMPDIVPNNSILPKEWLVMAQSNGYFYTSTKIDLYDVEVNQLIVKMISVASNISENNIKARQIADGNSWQARKLDYMERFKQLCE